MPENMSPDSSPISHKGLSTPSLICATVTLVIFLFLALFAYSCITSNIETREGRMAGVSFPQELEPFTIESVDGCWKTTEGDERLALRACYVPYVRVKLADVKAEGALYGRFADGQNKELGNMVPLYFNTNGFLPSNDALVKVDGFTAYVSLDQGFTAKSYFQVHAIDESQPLWRFNISYKISGENSRPDIGYTSINASLELPKND